MPIVGWRRVASDNPCDFCAVLVSLGAHYNTEEGADFEAHDRCSCTAEPVWELNAPEPFAVQDLQITFDRVTGGLSGREATTAFRRWWRDIGPFRKLDDAELRALDDDGLYDLFHKISSRRVIDDDAIRQVDREMIRREELAGRKVPRIEDDTPEQRRVDELLAQGRTIESAMADVYDLDEDVLRRKVLADTIDQDRKPGESRDAAARRLYEDKVYMQYLQAEDWTRGNFLNAAGRSAGIDPASLFSGTRARARKYASEELKRFWAEVTPRQTITEFKAEVLGRPSDIRAAARLATGHERDFGL